MQISWPALEVLLKMADKSLADELGQTFVEWRLNSIS